MADISDYTSKIPSANIGKPLFVAFLGMALQPFVDQINLAESVPELFDLDVAVGDQEDIVGEWLNLSRSLRAPLAGVYFSFDTVGVGFDQGVWYNSSLPLTGVINLDDETYRDFLKLKVRANTWDGSMGDANAALVEVFGSQGDPPVVWITDNFDMTQTYHITAAPHSALLEQLTLGGYMPFRPSGVANT